MPELMRQRGKRGVWYAECRHDGVHLQDCLKTTDRRLAERRLAELKFAVERGEYQKHKLKFDDLAEDYKREILPYKSEHSQERYGGILKKHLIPYFRSLRASQITETQVIEYKLERENVGATESTLKKELRVLKDVLKIADKNFEIPTSKDTPLMKFVHKGKRVSKFLEESDVQAIIGDLEDQHKAIGWVAAYTGLRLGNVINLKWKEVDIFNSWIQIETTKNSDPVRIPICGKLMEVLKGLNRVRNLHDDKIFHVTGRAFQKAWKRAREKAGFPWARVHDIRHSFASSLVNASVSIEVIGKLLNHRDLRSTRIYSHLADKTLKEAVSAFDKEPEPPRNVCKLPAKQEGTFKNKR